MIHVVGLAWGKIGPRIIFAIAEGTHVLARAGTGAARRRVLRAARDIQQRIEPESPLADADYVGHGSGVAFAVGVARL